MLGTALGFYFNLGDYKYVNIMDMLYEDFKHEQTTDPRKLVLFLEKKLMKDPYDLEGWLILARTCLITRNIQKADLYYAKANRYFPKNSEILFEAAILKNNIGQTNKSLSLLVQAHKLDDKSLKIKEQLIKTLMLLNKTDDANLIFEDIKKNKSQYKTSDLVRIKKLFEKN
tara:strand:- start:603 stop:1115 length:513 start_codon:yes stop_codon:yes gene_type:complete